jgi:hypothetical protein
VRRISVLWPSRQGLHLDPPVSLLNPSPTGWHNRSTDGGVLLIRLVVGLAGCLLPSTAAAQAWLDAYNAREYEKAAVLLHQIVTDPVFTNGGDPRPAHHLALLYAEGRGVTRDLIAACGLANEAERLAYLTGPEKPALTLEDGLRYLAGLDRATEFSRTRCSAVSKEDRWVATSFRDATRSGSTTRPGTSTAMPCG